jgi:succinate dehydrogenase / fumarate reductase, cytochrome b subunit
MAERNVRPTNGRRRDRKRSGARGAAAVDGQVEAIRRGRGGQERDRCGEEADEDQQGGEAGEDDGQVEGEAQLAGGVIIIAMLRGGVVGLRGFLGVLEGVGPAVEALEQAGAEGGEGEQEEDGGEPGSHGRDGFCAAARSNASKLQRPPGLAVGGRHFYNDSFPRLSGRTKGNRPVSTAAAPASTPVTDHASGEKSREASKIRHFLLRRLHSLTGIVFGGYIVVHLLINATMIQGGNVFQVQVEKIHSLPFLLAIEWAFIYIPIIFHTVYGIWLTFAAQPNVLDYPYGKNIFYTLQRISAIVIMFFVLFHVLGMKGFLGGTLTFDPHDATVTTARHINSHWFVAYVAYPIGVLASTFHLANGFWTAAITWGLTISKQAQRRWGVVCFFLFLLTFGCGMLAWIAALMNRNLVQS